jgi:hypothetical protein
LPALSLHQVWPNYYLHGNYQLHRELLLKIAEIIMYRSGGIAGVVFAPDLACVGKLT